MNTTSQNQHFAALNGATLDQWNGTKPVMMTRTEAEQFMAIIGAARTNLVVSIKAVDRRRTWSDAQKAMAKGPMRARIEGFELLHARIGEAFNLGGY